MLLSNTSEIYIYLTSNRPKKIFIKKNQEVIKLMLTKTVAIASENEVIQSLAWDVLGYRR